jgi:uncharacterized membrane protein
MNIRTPLIVSAVIVAAMIAASLAALAHLPAGAAIPIHWGADGHPNGWAKGWYAVFMSPAMAALVAAIFAAIPAIEPRRLNLQKSAKFYRASWISVLLLIAAMHGFALATALHAAVPTGAFVAGAVSLLMIVIGNYLGKTRSMFFGGIRTPWSLSSEYSWQRTHSLTGKLFVAAGVAGFVAAIVAPAEVAMRILAYGIGISAVVGIAASYVYWLRDPERRQVAQKP